jgi:hypothetical protein
MAGGQASGRDTTVISTVRLKADTTDGTALFEERTRTRSHCF